MNIIFEENTLTASQFLALRQSVGWSGDAYQIEKSLQSGLYNVSAKTGGQVIGMGRLVGDGIMYWYVQDVIVLPAHQGRGIGKAIVEYIITHIEKNSLPNSTVTIGLMAAKGKENFYNQFGFITRPTDIYGAGMIKSHMIPDKA